jgi:hypothetical protein
MAIIVTEICSGMGEIPHNTQVYDMVMVYNVTLLHPVALCNLT